MRWGHFDGCKKISTCICVGACCAHSFTYTVPLDHHISFDLPRSLCSRISLKAGFVFMNTAHGFMNALQVVTRPLLSVGVGVAP